MSFKVVQDLDTDNTTALGGINKKTGKPNPKQVEGYYIGSRDVQSNKSKNGFAKLHILQTDKGNLGVWGKTDLDRKLANVTAGFMVRLTCTGMQAIPGKNDMYKFKVEIDEENTIEVNAAPQAGASEEASFDDSEEDEIGLDDEEAPTDEVPYVAPKAATRPQTVNTERADRVKQLLSRNKAS